MSRKFINMYLEPNSMYGYWVVEFLDHDNTLVVERFETDLLATDFYNELILEKNSPQSN